MAKISKCSVCGKSESEVKVLMECPGSIRICDTCIEQMHRIIINDGNADGTNCDTSDMKPSEIKKHLDEYVIGQEEAKIAISVAVYNHYKRLRNNQSNSENVEIQKSNILMLGPTGSGKTYLAQTLARTLNVPFAIADSTSLTEAGYVGDDVESILSRLLQNADGDPKRAEMGIVYIDEIDKIARMSSEGSARHDVSREGVQQALLKILEGTEAQVPVSVSKRNINIKTVTLNTKNILFICGGAFDGLEELINEKKSSIGFMQKAEETEEKNYQDVTVSDLVKYGMMPEFIGRLPIITILKPLGKEALIDIMKKPKNSIIKQYEALMRMDGVDLKFEESALNNIAEKALERKSGARGLRSIIEKTMQNVMFSVPDRKDAKMVVIKAGVDGGDNTAEVYDSENVNITEEEGG